MDIRSSIRPLIVALVSIGLVVLVIVLIIKGITGHPSTPTNRVNVTKYADTSATATLLIDGPTNVDQDHRQLRITVSGTLNQIDVIQGYQGDVIKTQTYSSNSVAFGAFLQSLQLLNFSKGLPSTADYRGYCPTGDRYRYSFNDGQKDLFGYWSTSCGHQGTFQGLPVAVRQLFERQIPQRDLSELTNGINVLL